VARGTADLCVAGGALVGLGAAALVSGPLCWSASRLRRARAVFAVLKRRGALGNAAVALVAGLPLMYGAIAVGHAAAESCPGPSRLITWCARL